MMGIAPIFFWFARSCLRLYCVTWRSAGKDDGQAGQPTGRRFGTSIQNVVLSGTCQGIESHYSGLQCIWQI